jgi:hypothetical protein
VHADVYPDLNLFGTGNARTRSTRGSYLAAWALFGDTCADQGGDSQRLARSPVHPMDQKREAVEGHVKVGVTK